MSDKPKQAPKPPAATPREPARPAPPPPPQTANMALQQSMDRRW
jgi:hypothetical protein